MYYYASDAGDDENDTPPKPHGELLTKYQTQFELADVGTVILALCTGTLIVFWQKHIKKEKRKNENIFTARRTLRSSSFPLYAAVITDTKIKIRMKPKLHPDYKKFQFFENSKAIKSTIYSTANY